MRDGAEKPTMLDVKKEKREIILQNTIEGRIPFFDGASHDVSSFLFAAQQTFSTGVLFYIPAVGWFFADVGGFPLCAERNTSP